MFKQNEIQTAISENELPVRRSREECALIKLKGKIWSLHLHRESEADDIWDDKKEALASFSLFVVKQAHKPLQTKHCDLYNKGENEWVEL